MGRRGRRLRKAQRAKHQNKHHLLFQRKHWGDGYALLLRQAFVRDLDIDVHNDLHRDILHDMPRPAECQLKRAYERYMASKYAIDSMDILDACEWLITACDDSAYRECMKRQYWYLKSRLE
jgi:hypothetical protein